MLKGHDSMMALHAEFSRNKKGSDCAVCWSSALFRINIYIYIINIYIYIYIYKYNYIIFIFSAIQNHFESFSSMHTQFADQNLSQFNWLTASCNPAGTNSFNMFQHDPTCKVEYTQYWIFAVGCSVVEVY